MKPSGIICAYLAAAFLGLGTATAARGETVAAPATNQAAESRSRPTSEQIAAWISQLDDNRYLQREQATRNLLEAGDVALDPLLAAANADKPEPADRAIWVMRRISDTSDLVVRRQALERLVQLRKRPQLAGAARDALAQIRHNEAVAAIRQLGGRYIAGEFPMQYGQYMTPRIELDRAWRGGDEGLAHFRDLVGVPQVIIIGADVSAKGIAELQHVPDLADLWLYGTRLTEAEVPKITAVMPNVRIDFRRGGLLGVGSSTADKTSPAMVGMVQPGSAAADAGIQVGDIIKTFQGEAVINFESLTKMIGKYAEGEEVSLQVLRGDKVLDFKLKLGEWNTAN